MALTEVLKEIEAISFDGHRTQAEMGFNSLLRYGLGNITMGLSKLKLRWQVYLFEIVQNIALLHVNMSRNLNSSVCFSVSTSIVSVYSSPDSLIWML